LDLGSGARGTFDGVPRIDAAERRYRFETRLDGAHGTAPVASGAFDNIRNNPQQREVTFAPVLARFFRFTALRDVARSRRACVAEITVLPLGGR
jgi:alpha-L-fucosidase